MARSPRLIVRVVFVPGGAGAADARRRVADVLLRGARARASNPEAAPASEETSCPDASPTSEAPQGHMTDP